MKKHIGEDHSSAKTIFVVVCLKGGVGKSTVSASLAFYLANVLKKDVGLWDMDITSPSIPKILNLQGTGIGFTENGNIAPVNQSKHLKVMSVDFCLPSSDQPIVFDEKKKKNHMVQFLKSVEFGKCDYFVFDTPPTTSPELMTILKLFPSKKMRIILVTQPGEASSNSVRKSIQHLKATGIPITGMLTNMHGHTCTKCGAFDAIFPGVVSIEDIANDYGIPYLGRVELGWVRTTKKGASIIRMDKFKPIGQAIVKNRPVKFKPKKEKIATWEKMMIARKIDSRLNKFVKGVKHGN